MAEDKKSLSIVLPTWSGTIELEEMAINLGRLVRPMCDELVIVEDGGIDSYRLKLSADKYLWHRWNLGDIRNLTLGLWMASGDYVGVLNSDVTLQGNLRDLCIPGKVGCPVNLNRTGGSETFTDFCFVVDINQLRRIGYPTSSIAVGPDWDWNLRLEEISVRVPTVEATHIGGQSYSAMKVEGQKAAAKVSRKEIDPSRHRIRLSEDPEYGKLWANEKEE